MSAESGIITKDVTVIYRNGHAALRDASFKIPKGTITALVGVNGAGKSTLVKMIYGLIKPDSGTMTLVGHPYAPPEPRAARAAGVHTVEVLY